MNDAAPGGEADLVGSSTAGEEDFWPELYGPDEVPPPLDPRGARVRAVHGSLRVESGPRPSAADMRDHDRRRAAYAAWLRRVAADAPTDKEWRHGCLNLWWQVFREGYLAATGDAGVEALEDHAAFLARVLTDPAAYGYRVFDTREGPVPVKPEVLIARSGGGPAPFGLRVIEGGRGASPASRKTY